MGWHPLKVFKGKLKLKSKEEIEAVIQIELEKYWQEAVKHFHWEDLSDERKATRKAGFVKALEQGVRVKAYAFSDATSLKEYFAKQWEDNKRTLLHKWKMYDKKAKNKGINVDK
jgi:hypothetical protein